MLLMVGLTPDEVFIDFWSFCRFENVINYR